MGAKLLLPSPLLTVLHIFTNFHLKFSPSRLHAIRELRARFLAFRNGHLSLLRATATSKGTWNQSEIQKGSLIGRKVFIFFCEEIFCKTHCIHGILEIHVSLCVCQLDMELDLESLRLGFLKLEQPSCTWIWKSTCTCTWEVSYNPCTCTWALLWFPATRATIILDVAQVWDIKDVHAERNFFLHHLHHHHHILLRHHHLHHRFFLGDDIEWLQQ